MIDTSPHNASLLNNLAQQLEQALTADPTDAVAVTADIMTTVEVRDHAIVDLYMVAISQFCVVLNKISILMMRKEYEIAHGLLDSNITRMAEALEDGFPCHTPEELTQQSANIAREIDLLTNEIANRLSTFISTPT